MDLKDPELLRLLVDRHKANGRSQRAIAADARIHVSYIAHLLAGRSKTVSPNVAHNLARALGVSTELLFVSSSSSDTRWNVA